jgi:hypothetical protein
VRQKKLKEDDMAKAGLYALGLVPLFGVLILGAGFVLLDAVHARPVPLKTALVS